MEWAHFARLCFAGSGFVSRELSVRAAEIKADGTETPKKTIFEAVMVSVFGFNIILSVKGIYRIDILLEMKNVFKNL